jgi:ATP-dependent DNA helicase RecQ
VRPSHELDVHHIIPRALGGSDDPSNLTTLCDGCHSAKHPALQVSLARHVLERWGVRLARWLDRATQLPSDVERIGAAMRVLGIKELRPGQLDVILAALRGESVLFVTATGSGKSLCFQLPALLRPRCTVVVTPLKSLMTDQVAGLTERGIPSTYINSSLSREEVKGRLELIRRAAAKLIYVTPERLDPARNAFGRALVVGARPDFLVVDEAHCVDRWGEAFRPSYLVLGDARASMGGPPVLAFTATASAETQERVLATLSATTATRVLLDVDRPNVALFRVPDRTPESGGRLIRELLKLPHGGRAILFVQTRKRGEQLQELLRQNGLDLSFYHGKLLASEREFLQQRFCGRLDPPLNIIISTNAFGMGVDVPDVRLVIHWGVPASPSDYVQETGRAGRDGRPSAAVLIPRPDDARLHAYMLRATLEGPAAERAEWDREAYLRRRQGEVDEMCAMATARTCFRRLLASHFGARPAVSRESLAIRLLRWLYGTPAAVRESGVCCDACAGVRPDAVVEGVRAALFVVPKEPGVFRRLLMAAKEVGGRQDRAVFTWPRSRI